MLSLMSSLSLWKKCDKFLRVTIACSENYKAREWEERDMVCKMHLKQFKLDARDFENCGQKKS